MQLKSPLRLALFASLAISGMAMAQTPAGQSQNPPAATAAPADQPAAPAEAAPRKKAEEEIVVTGSRVRRKDLTTPAPVTVINKEQITASGIASIGDFLQQMPETGGGLNTNVNNGGDGETTISLRNLGAQRTLVLVDGKRWVNGGSGAGAFVDLNSIPTAAIERVEVLKDGASAVYGSDAIGGVVNIITRRRVNGVELSAYGATSPHGDAEQYDLSVTGGAAGEKGSFMFTGGYFDQKAMFAGKRDWATNALNYDFSAAPGSPGQITHTGSGTIPSGRARVDVNNCNGNALCQALRANFGTALKCKAAVPDPNNPGFNVTCFKYFVPDKTSAACAGPVAVGSNLQACQVQNWRPYVSSGVSNDKYNYQSVNYLITPSTRISLFTNGDYHIADFARAYFQGSFVNRQSQTLLAPEPLISSAFGVQIPNDNAYNPFGMTAGGPGQAVLDVRRRLIEANGRSSSFDLDTIRAVAGIDGTLPEEFGPLQGVFWDISFNYGRTSGTTTFNGSVNTSVTAQALGSTHPDPTLPGGFGCGTASNPIANCIPANVFGGAGALNAGQLASLGIYTGVDSGWTQIASAEANLSAELFKIASERPVGLAAGYDYRSEYGGFTPDPVGAAGLSFDFNSLPTKGSYHVNEGYAELDVPVVSNMTGVEDLEVQGAVRVFNYSTFGSDYTYKFGGRWRPIRDVTFRGTYSTGFRAPNISELYGGQAPSAEPATDPCAFAPPGSSIAQRCTQFAKSQGATNPAVPVAGNGDSSVQINSTVGGNPLAHPEKADIGTVGVVFEPTMLRGFSATLDYYNVKITQNLGAITTPVILTGCYAGGNDAYCALIKRDPATGFITNVSDLTTNTGSTQTSGFDLALRYSLPTEYGRFGFLFDSTYLVYYRNTLSSGQVIRADGNYDLGSGSAIGNLTPKVKFNAGVNYSIAGFNGGLRGRFIGGFYECAGNDGQSDSAGLCSQPQFFDANGNNVPFGTPGAVTYPAHHVSAYVAFDIYLSYLFKTAFGNTTLSAGVRNLLDKNPPSVYNAFLSYTDPTYDLVGRFVYGRITHAF